MNIICYKFSKKLNSTARPVNISGVTYVGNLKESTSILAPEIELQIASVPDVNYCYIPDFRRYYYVIGITCEAANLWSLSLSVDMLASFKDDIAMLDCYILRSSYDAAGNRIYDGSITDTTYMVTSGKPTYISQSVNSPYSLPPLAEGCYIIGCLGTRVEGEGTGAVHYYLLDDTQMLSLNNKLFSSVNWLDISATEISNNLQKALINPYQYIVSCLWCPMNISSILSAHPEISFDYIRFGWWNSDRQGYSIKGTSPVISHTISIPIPRHPDAAARGEYLNLSPYTQYTLTFYPFGSIDIDSQAIAGYNTLDLYSTVDMITGHAQLVISVMGTSNPIRIIDADVFVPSPTASMVTDYTNLSTGTLIAGGLYAGFNSETAGALSNYSGIRDLTGVLNAIGRDITSPETYANMASGASAMLTKVQAQSEVGARAIFKSNPYITLSAKCSPVQREDYDHHGRPLCQHKRINQLSGYVQVDDMDIRLPCTEPEQTAIVAYMTSGFFFE